ncbi:hypothetical protein JAO76_15785 [Pontibacter sp. BT310]|uniref:DUF4476 domain-containing protein n=1 Tax=Pontibacter populi TaxID=890055 RepID=A0ABS6XF50_9BACT|nr:MULTISPECIES: hypothetical protein [Pontibacter]MBJ6119668.1 hypothetical protein [Pontibacter sp. BT310]MBR0572097.1 hypothetical protein [Microvirga sp. STS03]MBW3366521.1 hypothetical protein [Pontibacter populi]
MKRLLITTLASLSIVLSAAANGNERSITVESRATNLSDQMIRELRLNNYQANKVREINMDVVAKMMAVEAEFKGNQELIEQKCKSICSERDVKLENVLSTVQYNDYFGDRPNYTKFDKEFVAGAGQTTDNAKSLANNTTTNTDSNTIN